MDFEEKKDTYLYSGLGSIEWIFRSGHTASRI